jgi:hypothetical protein
MPQCPKCRYRFRVMDDEDDGQHSCPSCGYGNDRCDYCGKLQCFGLQEPVSKQKRAR